MRRRLLRGKVSKALLAFAILFGVGIAFSLTAQAQYPYGRDRYGYDNVYRIAQEQGYRDGVEHGAEHAREGHRYDPQGTRHYKDGDSGYRHEYGNRDEYKQAYREGFLRGYDAGFNRYQGGYGGYNGRGRGDDPYYRDDDPYYRNNDPYRRNGRYGGYGNNVYRIAQEQGYRDGVEHGAEHAREGHRYDPQGTRHYKDGDSGYRHEYGSRDEYKQAYRDGFLRGYEEGYRRNDRYRGGYGYPRSGGIFGGIFGRP